MNTNKHEEKNYRFNLTVLLHTIQTSVNKRMEQKDGFSIKIILGSSQTNSTTNNILKTAWTSVHPRRGGGGGGT